MKHLDNRVRYTKMILQNALLQILRTKRIDKVTIKEICELAEVNRGTFYLHYSTPNDLLMEIEQQFIDENISHFSSYMALDYETIHLAEVFSCILQNQELCRVIMGKNGNPRFVERIQQLVRPSTIDSWQAQFPDYDRSDLDYVFDYAFTGSMRLILNWIDDNRGMSAEELARRLDRLGHYCHLAIREFKK
uniref:Transcriptional regulator n=1 Tax=uncultured bacterium scaffold00056 TaxID=1132475 RepID=I7AI46_9BACT|nr:transcriptional regulator [uncultured bacterium scaffold00056]